MRMTIQTLTLLLSLAAVAALAAVFLRVRVLAPAGSEYPAVQADAYRLRRLLFWALVLVGLPVTVWLLRETPYGANATEPQVVNVSSAMWFWDLDRDTVEADRPVEFHVTSTDVNHGFGLYDPSGRLVAQTQAMPGYVNVMTHVFEDEGTYRVLCLEYCGLVHHGMETTLTVTATGGGNG